MLSWFSPFWFAHTPTPGLGDFWNGVLHPFVDLQQLFTVLALGVAMAREEQAESRRASYVTGGCLLVMLALHLLVQPKLPSPSGLSLLFAGLLLVRPPHSLQRYVPFLVVPAAVALGHSIGPDLPSKTNGPIFALGFSLGCLTLLNYVMLGWSKVQRSWLVLASRIGGSWLVAIGLMLTAGSLAGTFPKQPTAPTTRKTSSSKEKDRQQPPKAPQKKPSLR